MLRLKVLNKEYVCLQFKLANDGLNCCYRLQVDVVLPPLEDGFLLLNHEACFFHLDDKDLHMAGDIHCVWQLDSCSLGCLFRFELRPPLARLARTVSYDYFTNSYLKAIFRYFFHRHQIRHVRLNFKDRKHLFSIQYHQTDLNFFIQLIIQYGLLFFHHYQDGQMTLIVEEKVQHPKLFQLQLIDKKGMPNDMNVAFELSMCHQLLADDVFLISDGEKQIFKSRTQNKSNSIGRGTLEIYDIYDITAQEDNDYHAFLCQQQLDWQRQLLKVKTAKLSLRPGSHIQLISDKPDESMACYEILLVNIENDIATIILKSIHLPYKQPIEETQIISKNQFKQSFRHLLNYDDTIPNCFLAAKSGGSPGIEIGRIVKTNANGSALIKGGKYRVSLLLNEDKVTHAIPILSAYTGIDGLYGCQFPLYERSIVMIGFINDNHQKPFILGVIDQFDVNGGEKFSRIPDFWLRSKNGSFISIDEENRTMVLATSNKALAININNKKNVVSIINKYGDIILSSNNSYQKSCFQHDLLHAETFIYKVGGDLKSVADCSVWNIAKQMMLTTRVNAYIEASNLLVNGETCSFTNTSMVVKSTSTVQMVSKKIQLSCEHSGSIKGDKELLIKTAKGSLSISKSGQLTILGDVKFKARTISFHDQAMFNTSDLLTID